MPPVFGGCIYQGPDVNLPVVPKPRDTRTSKDDPFLWAAGALWFLCKRAYGRSIWGQSRALASRMNSRSIADNGGPVEFTDHWRRTNGTVINALMQQMSPKQDWSFKRPLEIKMLIQSDGSVCLVYDINPPWKQLQYASI